MVIGNSEMVCKAIASYWVMLLKAYCRAVRGVVGWRLSAKKWAADVTPKVGGNNLPSESATYQQ